MYNLRVFPKHNLAIIKVANANDFCISDVFAKADDFLFNHPDYKDKMNIIMDYRQAVFPNNQLFYNDLTHKLILKCCFNYVVRLMNDDQKTHNENLNIFQIFYKGKPYRTRTYTVLDVQSALDVLALTEDAEDCIKFLTEE